MGDKAARAKSGRETSLGDRAATADKSEIIKEITLGNKAAVSQERNQEGRQAWEARRQRQARAKSGREASLGDKAAAAAKSEIRNGDKLGRQGGSGSQERNQERRPGGSGSQFPLSGTRPLRSKSRYSFQLSGEKRKEEKRTRDGRERDVPTKMYVFFGETIPRVSRWWTANVSHPPPDKWTFT